MAAITLICCGFLSIFIILTEAKYGDRCSSDFDCLSAYEVCNHICVCSKNAHLRNGKCISKTICKIDNDCEDDKYCSGKGICQNMWNERSVITGYTGYKEEIAGIIIGSVVASVILVSVVIVFAKRRGYSWATGTSVSLS